MSAQRGSMRIGFLQACILLGLGLVLGRAAQLQLLEGGKWAEQAERRRTERQVLEARRGTIYDRRGRPLAVSQEFFHVGLAPNEVTERGALVRAASRALGMPARQLERDLRTKKYAYYYGPFTASQLEPIRDFRGVHLEREYRRAYLQRALAAPVVGRLRPDSGQGGSGIELTLDSLLRGVPGEAVLLRDRRGRRFESPGRRVRDPVAGHDVWLTIDAELQDIAERALEDAVREFEAEGGDIVFLEPKTGEILAVASRQVRAGRAEARPTAFTDPFEPGSTAKLFSAAALLRLGRIEPTDAVSGEGGTWRMPLANGSTRTITDVHREDGQLTLADAIRYSSNIAMAKFSDRLSPVEQYEALRDFGFGSPTGVEFPSESRGRLERPGPYFSRASHAMGYEFSVTAVQLASAYAAIANDGVLMTPTLVREIRAPDGRAVYAHRPEPVRRVVSSELAAQLRGYLRLVMDRGGSGERSRLANFELVGKTGTARMIRDGRYVQEYVASFASLFPAEDPQLAIVVKLSGLDGARYYGGQTAAPVTRQMLEQALASRRIALDRRKLLPAESLAAADTAARAAEAPVPVVAVSWPLRQAEDSAADPVTVPAVTGRPVRAAALALHQRGFRVDLRGTGTVVRSAPEAGAAARPGTLVTLWTTE